MARSARSSGSQDLIGRISDTAEATYFGVDLGLFEREEGLAHGNRDLCWADGDVRYAFKA